MTEIIAAKIIVSAALVVGCFASVVAFRRSMDEYEDTFLSFIQAMMVGLFSAGVSALIIGAVTFLVFA